MTYKRYELMWVLKIKRKELIQALCKNIVPSLTHNCRCSLGSDFHQKHFMLHMTPPPSLLLA